MNRIITRLSALPRKVLFSGIAAAIVLWGAAVSQALAIAANQPEGDVTSWPVVVAFLAVLSIAGVASFIAAILRKAEASTNVKPQSIVYIVCFGVVLVGYFTGGGELPMIDFGNPAATVTGWFVLAGALGKLSEVLYDIAFKLIFPQPVPDPLPPPAF